MEKIGPQLLAMWTTADRSLVVIARAASLEAARREVRREIYSLLADELVQQAEGELLLEIVKDTEPVILSDTLSGNIYPEVTVFGIVELPLDDDEED